MPIFLCLQERHKSLRMTSHPKFKGLLTSQMALSYPTAWTPKPTPTRGSSPLAECQKQPRCLEKSKFRMPFPGFVFSILLARSWSCVENLEAIKEAAVSNLFCPGPWDSKGSLCMALRLVRIPDPQTFGPERHSATRFTRCKDLDK